MNIENVFRFAWNHCPGGYFGRMALGMIIISMYLYALAFIFYAAFILVALGSLYLLAKAAWISAESFKATISRNLGYSGNGGPSLGLCIGAALIFVLYCELLLLVGVVAAPDLSQQAFAVISLGLLIFGEIMILPPVLLLGSQRESGGGAAGSSSSSSLKNQAFDSLRYGLADCWRQIIELATTAYHWIVSKFFRGRAVWVLWPLGLAGLAALITPVAVSALLFSAIAILHAGVAVLLRAIGGVLAPAWARISNR